MADGHSPARPETRGRYWPGTGLVLFHPFGPAKLIAELIVYCESQFIGTLYRLVARHLDLNCGMKIKAIIHNAEEGGYWAEVPAIPGCVTQGETFEELLQNLYEAVEGCLAVDISPTEPDGNSRVLEIAV